MTTRNKLRPLPTLCLTAAAALPAVVPLWIIFVFGVDFPYLDQWDPHIAGLFVKAHHGQLSIGDFLAQHNEHRIVVPRLVFFVLGSMTHWNTIAEMIFGWLLACGSSAGILWLCAMSGDDKFHLTGRASGLWFLCNLLIFSPAQWENWVWGIGIVNLMSCFWMVLAIVAARSTIRFGWRCGLTMLCAVAAQYSCGNGVLCWPLAGMALFWREAGARRSAVIAWIAGFLFFTGLYFVGYQRPATSLGQTAVLTTIGAAFHYLLAFLGGPWAYSMPLAPITTATAIGSILLLLFLTTIGYVFYSRDLQITVAALPWLALAGFAVLSGATAALFRAAQGPQQALASRYVTTAIYLPLALVNLIPIVAADLQRRRRPDLSAQKALLFHLPGGAIACVLILLGLLSLPALHAWLVGGRSDHQGWRAGVMLAGVMPDDNPVHDLAGNTYQLLLNEARTLNEMGYLRPGLIRTTDTNELRDPNPMQDLGEVERMRADLAEGRIGAAGWAIDPRRREPAHLVLLAYEDEQHRNILVGMSFNRSERPDIVQVRQCSGYLMSGWFATLPLSAVPASIHELKISTWVFDADTGKAVKLLEEGRFTR